MTMHQSNSSRSDSSHPNNPQSDHSQTATGPQLPAQAIVALRGGRKIDAIKIVRTQTGLCLKDSKALVEAYRQQHPQHHPQHHGQSHAASSVAGITATKSRHGVTVGILVLLLVVLMLGLIFF